MVVGYHPHDPKQETSEQPEEGLRAISVPNRPSDWSNQVGLLRSD